MAHSRALVAVLLTSITLLSGCGGSDSKAALERSSTPTEASPQTASTTSDTPSLTIGQEADLTIVKVKVFAYRKGIPDQGSPPDKGMRLDAALLRVCNVSFQEPDPRSGELTDPFNFQVYDADDGSYDLYDLSPSPAPQPQFPNFRSLKPGQCTKGWMAFDVTSDLKPQRITYGEDGQEAATWTLSK